MRRRTATGRSFRLSGGAGTGKTVVALHRTKHLADANPDARILLTTYTKTLAESLGQNLAKLDPTLEFGDKIGASRVTVAGIDSVARQVWNQSSQEEKAAAMSAVFGDANGSVGKPAGAGEWNAALAQVDHGLDADLATAGFLEQEYEAIVLANSITDRDGYLKASRAGRGTALNRAKRAAVWLVIEAYRRLCGSENAKSYAEVAALAAAALRHQAASDGGSLLDHVVVDEAQDLHAGHWLLLRALVTPGPNDLFIAEDSHQRIYGQKVPLSRFGIQIIGRSRRLTLNYRTTAQNLAFAVAMLTGAGFTDLEGNEEKSSEYRSARSGPKPVFDGGSSLSAELDRAAERVRAWLDEAGTEPERIGILVRSKVQQDQVVSGLRERGVEVRAVTSTS